jgi:phosphoribosylformylglycinamidine cyclo-ligase
VVEKDAIIDGSRVAPGDSLVGLASSGPHSNGYSLVRRILELRGVDVETPLEGSPIADLLLAPTRIYVKPLLSLIAGHAVHALAHITGGGLLENLPRVLPQGTRAVIDTQSWPRPPIFHWLQEEGGIDDEEMYRTFNCGIGMVVAVPAAATDAVLAHLIDAGETAWPIGRIEAGGGEPEVRLA